jgi:folate-binding protein YgfZ
LERILPIQKLNDRTVLCLNGSEATSFLQGLITANVETLKPNTLSPSALLTPQGKIAFDFLIGTSSDGYIIDVRTALVDDFLKRLTMYKLRADVTIAKQDDMHPHAMWATSDTNPSAYQDLRFPASAQVFRTYIDMPDVSATKPSQASFDEIRIQNGVAESGSDFDASDIFPHEIYFDLNNGIDFRKGCYVGQEVVSRMQHRGTARKRVAIIKAEQGLPAYGTQITAGGKAIGTLGTSAGKIGLAIIRVDRYFDALKDQSDILADTVPLGISFPNWAQDAIKTIQDGGQK